MKNIKIWAIAIVSILAFSCDNNDEDIPQQIGKWRFAKISSGFTGHSYDFEGETVTWEFDAGNTLTIVNNNTEDVFDGPNSGIYTYEILASESPVTCTENIKIDNWNAGCMTISNDTLFLNDTYADGNLLTFVRIPTNQTN